MPASLTGRTEAASGCNIQTRGMRTKLILIVLPLLLGGWFDDPPAWARPDGRPIDPVVFAYNRSVCRYQAWPSPVARTCGS